MRTDKELHKLSKLSRIIEPGPNGQPRHVSTLRRYVIHGKKGVRLRAWALPDGLYSSLAEWRRFVRRLTMARAGVTPSMPFPSEHRQNLRQNTVEAQIEAVRKSLRRKEGGES